MRAEQRRALVAEANRISRESSRAHGPSLAIDSGAEHIASWLQWCDPNGCHTPQLARIEGFDPYDLDAAWDALKSMLENQ